jgi:predicted aspartyl protease
MSHSPLLKFNFIYNDCFGVPLIPITFLHKDGTKAQLLNNAILDTGANEITIPKSFAEMLGLQLIPRTRPAHTAAGESPAFTATADFILGRGSRDVEYKNIDMCVMEKCPAILIGIRPIFEEYKVTIMAYKKTCVLEPKE